MGKSHEKTMGLPIFTSGISHDRKCCPLWTDIQLATGSDWCGIALLKIHWLFSGRVN
jgi:hypothetical protein